MASGSQCTHQAIGQFRTTHWSVVLAAGRSPSPGKDAALAKICQGYWYPVYAYVRRRGFESHTAQDLTQEFFYRLLQKDFLAGLSEEGGRFRSFLLTALKHFLANEWTYDQAQKRGGGCQFVALDGDPESRYRAEPSDPSSPDVLFERRWATTLLGQVMRRVEEEYRQWKKADLFSELHPFLAGFNDAPPYREVGTRLGMNEGAVKVAVHRLRKRYGELLREEIGRTVSSPEEIEEEIRYLICVLAK